MPRKRSDRPRFFDDTFEPIVAPVQLAWDDDVTDPEASTYSAAEPGPTPVPDWVITSDDARQVELGPLKSGKEAVVHIVERTHGDRRNLLAAKRYKDVDDRTFRDDVRYREARRSGDRRLDLAMAKGTRRGMAFRAREWAVNEFTTLGRLWSAGAAVPYPVQLLGTELLLEYIGDDTGAAPRLAAARLSPDEVASAFTQVVDAVHDLARAGVVHGDLSAYNLLWWEERVFVIDLPQSIDPLVATDGMELVARDVHNVCRWFSRHGIDADESALVADVTATLLGRAW